MQSCETESTADRAAGDAQRYARAEQLFAAGDVDGACSLLLDLVQEKTEDWQPYNDLGVLSANSGDFDTAISYLQQAMEREPATAVACSNLANMLSQRGKEAAAARVWARALVLHGPRELCGMLLEFLASTQNRPASTESFFTALKSMWRDAHGDAADTHAAARSQYRKIVRHSSLAADGVVLPAEPLSKPDTVYHFEHDQPGLADTFPAIRCYALANIIVRPDSELVQTDSEVIIADHIDPAHHLLYDTATGYATPLPGAQVCVIRPLTSARTLKAGVILNSYAVHNWAHFLTEVAPLVALVETQNIPTDVPLVISANAPAQTLAMIDRLKALQREVIQIDEAAMVRQATLLSPSAKVSFDFIANTVNEPPRFTAEDSLFSPAALRLTRERLCGSIEARHAPVNAKLFVVRQSTLRRMHNRQQVLEFFTALGFQPVMPETLSAEEQIRLFSTARIIVGQAGAGIANMMLAPEKCRVIVLATNTPFNVFGYFANMAACLGHELHYFGFAPIKAAGENPAHSDFVADMAQLHDNKHLFA